MRGRRSAPLAFAAALLALASAPASQTIWHVDASAAPGGDGRAWATAMDDLQLALDVATPADQIWVAAGTYHPTVRAAPSTARTERFHLTRALQLFGGFTGTETSLGQRDPARFLETVLSADLGIRGDPSDNANHVVEVTTFAVPSLARIDGFRITGGNASGNGGAVLARNTGSGFNPHLRLENCTLNDNAANKGGAISVERFGVVELVRCVVERNRAANVGGAVYSKAGGILAVDTRFSENKAARLGGVLFAEASHRGWIEHANCVFVANRARSGGVAYLAGDTFSSGIGSWVNCTFAANEALASGGVLFANTSTPVQALAYVYNSILWDNVAASDPAIFGSGLDVRFCDVQGGYPGAGNLDVDPRFVALGRPGPGSPVNDAGSNAIHVNDHFDLDRDGDTDEAMALDFLDQPRRTDDPLAPDTGVGSAPLIDMGAYEADPRSDAARRPRPF